MPSSADGDGDGDGDGVRVFQGTVDGILATEPGHRTYAQLSSAEKNTISHRGRAVEAMRTGLELTGRGAGLH